MSCHIKIVYSSLCLLAILCIAQGDVVKERRCYSTELQQCWVGESCVIQTGTHPAQGGEPDGLCTCLRSHQRDDRGYCMPVKPHPALPTPAQVNSTTKSSSSSIAAGILVPLFFIGVCVLVVLARRYGWWERLRQPRVRHYDTALVGGDLDDDPPIS